MTLNISRTTWIELLEHRAETEADKTAVSFIIDSDLNKRDLTHRQLANRALSIAAGLQQRGVVKGQRVIISTEAGLEFVAAFFGCLFAGVIAVPTFPPKPGRSDTRLHSILGNCTPSAILTTQACKPLFDKQVKFFPSLKAIPILITKEFDPTLTSTWQRPTLAEDSIAMLQYTSGSTSDPKGVQLTHQNTLQNCLAMEEAYGHDRSTRAVSWLPPFHDMGMIGGILHPIFTGFETTLMSWLAVIDKPILWLRAIQKFKATSSGGPNFIYDHCVDRITTEEKSGLDLSTWNVAVSGAEPIRRQTLEQFYLAFRENGFKKEAYYPSYGMAESTLFVTGSHGQTTAQQRLSSDSVSCGVSSGDQILLVVDPDTFEQCQEKEEGEVWISGPSVAKGYWKKDEINETVFNAQLPHLPDRRFLRSGDFGYLDNNELYITSRIKDLIIYRGRNIYPQDVELTVETAHEALRTNFGAAFSVQGDKGEGIVVAQELKLGFRKVDPSEVFANILRRIDEEFHFVPKTILLTRPGSIPKTSSGKIQRSLCKSQVEAGTIPIVHQWPD